MLRCAKLQDIACRECTHAHFACARIFGAVGLTIKPANAWHASSNELHSVLVVGHYGYGLFAML